ncbi:MAG: fumarate hydratase [Firmicutes bacterium]|nr:fumarate hydratase [Bacillota bacterium]
MKSCKEEPFIKTITVETISEAVANLCQESNYYLGPDMLEAFQEAFACELSPTGKEIIQQLLSNAQIAAAEKVPICQDTGFTVVFIELGQDVHITGGLLEDAVNEGVRRGYTTGYLRKSIVGHPLERVNTGDNTPAVLHVKLVRGEQMKIIVAPKGGGSENMSAVKMLKPAEGVAGVKKFILDVVSIAGPNPCPPIVVGVGIGGTMEKAALLAKEALLRPVGTPSPKSEIASLEREILQEVNGLGIGPQGLGGLYTALAVQVEIYPAHIASLPVAVNISCHANRHREVIL